MSARAFAFVLVLATAAASLDFSAAASPSQGSIDAPPSVNPARSETAAPRALATPSIDPDLADATGPVNVLVALDDARSYEDVAALFQFARTLPAAGGIRILRGTIDASRLSELEGVPGLRSVLKDRPIAFPASPLQANAPVPANRFRYAYEPSTAIERDALGGGPEVTMYDVVDFTGARRAWDVLGVDGTGVTIAVVDTGVDHGAMDLGDAAVARDASGLPTSFDPDGGTFGRTTLALGSYSSAGRTFIRTAGTNPLIFIFDLAGAYGPAGPTNLSWSDPRLFNAAIPSDFDITGLPVSLSGVYHFGVLAEWHLILPFIYLDLFPVVVIDPGTAGVYDAAVLDLTFDWWLNGHQTTPDLSFADEKVLRVSGGPFVASRDMDADGYPDVSAGSLASGLDLWGLEATPSERYRVLPPIDPDGNHVVLVYDWIGHGTSVAATAAGRETAHAFAGPGIAPGARIMGVPIFFSGDVIEGWLWAAGFDLVDRATPRTAPGSPTRYGAWTYTGNHRADVISNSWGVSEWLTFPWFFSSSWYDLVTVVEDALMTPGYSDPAYPGTLIVHAGGNGGAGYGTVTEPSFSSLALSVGASTSLDHTSLDFGGFHNDVMSWSARGPNALGAPKPDVVMVGAFAYTAGAPWSGNGTGSAAYTLFGGTSQATPATAGSAAVAIQAYRATHGRAPTPFEIKSILKSTAEDLGYDAFVQGAGQVNVYNAAAFAQGREGVLVTSDATWEATRPRLAEPWAGAAVVMGDPIHGGPPDMSIADTSWFAGAVAPGGSAAASFSAVRASGIGTASLSAVSHQRTTSLTRTGTTATLGAGWLEGYGALVPLLRTDIAAGADLMVVRASIAWASFDPEFDQIWNNRVRIVVGDWIDGDANGIVAPGEVRVFNYGYNTGTTVEARVGFPANRFVGRPLLWLSQLPSEGRPFATIGFTLQVEFYDRVPWSWVSVPSTAPVPGTISATLRVPSDAAPGVYEGQILVQPSAGNGTVVPVSVVVPRVIDGSTMSAGLTAPPSTAIYDASVVSGYFDWRWRYEAGDWRLWFVRVDDPNVIALRVNASWKDRDTDVDIWSLNPAGIPQDASFSPYGGEGNFRWDTRTGRAEEFVIVQVGSSFSGPGPGMYTFALHNVLYGSTAPQEPLSGQVAVTRLTPRGPLTFHARPGATVSTSFTLSSGFPLTSLLWQASPPPGVSSFPGTTFPSTMPTLPAGGSRNLLANFTVPEGTPDGTYENYVVLSSAQVFTVVRVDVVVDSVAPELSILLPDGNVVGGQVAIVALAVDDGGFGSVTFDIGSSSGSLTRGLASSVWNGSWDSHGTPDGPVSLRIVATDAAGNANTFVRDLIVDNTKPIVELTAPSDGATVTGTVTISWSIQEANPGVVFLTIDGEDRIVTGNTSFAYDTTRVGDGPHRIELFVADQAGNTAIERATVTVRNQDGVSTANLIAGIGIGAILAAIVGFGLGVIFARRRRKVPPTMMPPPSSPPSLAAAPPSGPPPTPPEPRPPAGPP